MTQHVTLTINGQPYEADIDRAIAARALHPRGGQPDGHAHWL